MNAIHRLRHFASIVTTESRARIFDAPPRLAVLVLLPVLAALALSASAQTTFQSDVVKHLTTSRDFSLKVADAMPAADYGFKLTPAQMSFAGQMIHLSQGLTYFLSTFSGQKT